MSPVFETLRVVVTDAAEAALVSGVFFILLVMVMVMAGYQVQTAGGRRLVVARFSVLPVGR